MGLAVAGNVVPVALVGLVAAYGRMIGAKQRLFELFEGGTGHLDAYALKEFIEARQEAEGCRADRLDKARGIVRGTNADGYNRIYERPRDCVTGG